MTIGDADTVILSGGLGTRLHPLTIAVPKPMLPCAGVPFLAHLLGRLAGNGVPGAVLATSFRDEVVSHYFASAGPAGMTVRHGVEPAPLGTGGGLRNVLGLLERRDVLVLNGDTLSGVDLAAMVEHHRRHRADATIHLVPARDTAAYGSVVLGEGDRVRSFQEKDGGPAAFVNAGCYLFDRRAVEAIPHGRPVSLERDVLPAMLARGARVFGYPEPTYWIDVGTPASFVQASRDLVVGRLETGALPGHPGEALVLPGARIADSATILGGTVVGAGCMVGPGTRLEGAVLFDGARVDAGASVVRSVLAGGAEVGAGGTVLDAVVGDRARIGPDSHLPAGTRLWPDVTLPAGTRYDPVAGRGRYRDIRKADPA